MPIGCATSTSVTESEGAARASPDQDERGGERDRQEPVGRGEPDDPLRHDTPSGRLIHVSDAGSRTPPSQPTSPPSTLAAAVAGYGVPAVQRLKSDGGRHDHDGDDREDRHAPERQRARGDEERNEQEGLRARQHGQRRARAPSRARRSRACARSAPATRSAASETSIPDSAPQATGPDPEQRDRRDERDVGAARPRRAPRGA